VFVVVGRRPLFPGRDYKHQVEVICSILGKPSIDQMQHICSENAKKFLANLPDSHPKDFRTLYPDAHDDCIDLLRKMIRFTPSERISAADALGHSYFADYVSPRFCKAPANELSLLEHFVKVNSTTPASNRIVASRIVHCRC
jgi:mitogen-activated protein kinase 7